MDYNKVGNHQLNNSTSKQLYSFSKSKRFQFKSYSQSDYTMNLPTRSFLNKRAAGFGYGSKIDFTKVAKKDTPCLTKYKIKTKPNGPYFSFGESRKKMEIGSITGPLLKNKNPGPGTYKISSTKSRISYSFGSKLNNKLRNSTDVFYNLPTSLNSEMQFPNSKWKNYGSNKINPIKTSHSKLKSEDNSIWPYYDIKTGMSKTGYYFNSKFDNSKSQFFSKSKRNFFKTKNYNIPPPASYNLFSEFGKSPVNK